MDCSICLNPIKLTRSTRQLQCGHCFHGKCFETWDKLHGTCPLCRRISDPSKYKVTMTIENTQNRNSISDSLCLVDVEEVLSRLNINFSPHDVSVVEISLENVEDLMSFLSDIGRPDTDTTTLHTH
jgi:hypothetical protein